MRGRQGFWYNFSMRINRLTAMGNRNAICNRQVAPCSNQLQSGGFHSAGPTGFLILISVLIQSCAPFANPQPAAAAPDLPSPTPFQPDTGAVDSPFAFAYSPEIEATFTPIPTPYLPAASLPTPVELVSSAAGELQVAFPNVTNPLTGLAVSNPELLNRRPMAVKIANSPDQIRPQSGLSLADVVFEYYIEWGDTRFIAVFYGNDAKMAGPVRSGRYFDEHVARMYHSYYVFQGADPRELNYFLQSDFSSYLVDARTWEFPCSTYEIGGKGLTYNRIFFNTIRFAECLNRKGLENTRPSLRSSFYSEQPMTEGSIGSRIFSYYSAYSYNYWEFDPDSRKYYRYQEANGLNKKSPPVYTPLMDALTGLTVSAENVIVLFVPHTFKDSFEQEDEVYHIDLIDSGEAMVFRDGFSIPARWYRTDVDQPLLITNLSGTPIYLKPGVTFFEVIGISSMMTQEGNNWRFRFLTP